MTAAHCATQARVRNDPLAGTAAPAHRWLLIEYPGPWATHALDSRLIPLELANRLEGLARSMPARVLLIRRPGRRTRQEDHAWVVVDHDAGQHWGSWREAPDLEGAADALAGEVAPSGPQEPLMLVCTHGLHDTCCAMRGRPVAAALAARWPLNTWECSHVGGDRFAANLLLLPDGVYYGSLSATTALPVVESHLAGAVTPEHLRGVSTEEPVVQAAIIEGHARLGPGGARDLVGAGLRPLSPNSWRVRLAGGGSMPTVVEATVTRRRQPPARLTCRALGDSAAYVYDVTDLRALDSAGRAPG